jgi:hypothetical protein
VSGGDQHHRRVADNLDVRGDPVLVADVHVAVYRKIGSDLIV